MKVVFLFMLLFVYKTNAQKNELRMPHFQCIYTTLFNKSIDEGHKFMSCESTLYISGEKSVFYTLPSKTNNTENIENNFYIDLSMDTMFKVIKYADKEFLKFKDDAFSKKGKMYSDTLYPMKWSLIEENKMLDSLQCFKATTVFKGRNYIAWYCPQIAITNGPWKLGGLPGLIVEAYDETKQMYFKIQSVKEIKIAQLEQQLFGADNITLFPNYPMYIKSGKEFMNKIIEQFNASSSDKCISCQETSKIKFNNWEKVFN